MKRIFVTFISAVFIFSALAVYAEEVPVDQPVDSEIVSEGDVSATDSVTEPGPEPVEFIPAEVMPYDVDIPYFYTKVENTMGLYIFMTADGAVHKRCYGSVNGVYGWYVANGADNKVYSETPDAYPEDDLMLYEASPWEYTGTTTSTAFGGLLPPEQKVSSLDSLFGVRTEDLFKVLAAVTIVVCMFIVLKAGRSARRIAKMK